MELRADGLDLSGPWDDGAAVRSLADARGFSGAILVDGPGGRCVHAAGEANRETGEPNTPGTRFNSASITKLFTAVAVCRLAEAGKLVLSAPVASVLGPATVPASVRVEHLLAHTSGLPEEADHEVEPSAAGWLAAVPETLEFAAGSRWGYSNVGYGVLGAMIEQVTGMPYFDAMQVVVFGPAGLSATGFEDTAVAVPGRALGYLDDGSGSRGTDNRASGIGRGAPWGYASTTLADLERFVRLVASATIVDENHAGRILHGDIPTGDGRLAGFGMFRQPLGGVDVSTTSGAGPGISAWLDVAPARGFLSIVLSNLPKPAAHGLGEALRIELG